MKRICLLLLIFPCCLVGQPTVLVNTIPSAATFAGTSAFQLPFQDAESQDPKSIEQGISSAVAGILQAAERQGFSNICLVTSPGENPVEVFIPVARATLKLRRTQTTITVVFYKGGERSVAPIAYSTEPLDIQKPNVAMKFQKVSVPAGVTTAGWVYFNLPRIQAAATKAGAKAVNLGAEGTGPVTEVAIPGLKDPLRVPEEKPVLTASWYLDADAEARLRKSVSPAPPH
jgi:hypothetical protein